jgi:hypothetical protein
MFAFMLESLVLRGVVRKGELAVLRLGFGVKAGPQVPGDVNSMLQTQPDMRGVDPHPTVPAGNYPNQSIRSGAGRSRRHAGSSLRREIASFAACWWQKLGGTATAAAAKARALPALFATTAGEITSLAILPISPGGASERSR